MLFLHSVEIYFIYNAIKTWQIAFIYKVFLRNIVIFSFLETSISTSLNFQVILNEIIYFLINEEITKASSSFECNSGIKKKEKNKKKGVGPSGKATLRYVYEAYIRRPETCSYVVIN